ncbi:hypothetical protein XCV4462 [Xanthomonas euvesicatoria pv. vesicatoria str. 85-10]|uniref:Uncharacterized protein n=1 Tax=Xanthomonas euvesicatoria pv. vesicatoria (strain 85-10) TaxID=316273 RepID=Q3BM20_XANE5|nr:hypothetical protein XCV4462 [Xanthomonas euvesicatoria pv. vesicatoria str. 85-10]
MRCARERTSSTRHTCMRCAICHTRGTCHHGGPRVAGVQTVAARLRHDAEMASTPVSMSHGLRAVARYCRVR